MIPSSSERKGHLAERREHRKDTKPMNRIYQGRVGNVEIANPDKHAPPDQRWLPFDPDPKKAKVKWQAALWQHHELFQDAVNYYLVALAALADPAHSSDRLIKDLRVRIEAAWETFPRPVSGEATTLRKSVGRWLSLSDEAVPQDAYEAILQSPEVSPEVRCLALALLLDRCGGEAAIQQGGRGYLPRFCVAKTNPTYDYSRETLEADSGNRTLSEILHGTTSDEELNQLADSLDLSWTVKLQPGKFYTAEESVARLKEALGHVAGLLKSAANARIEEVRRRFPDFEAQFRQFDSGAEGAVRERPIPRNRKASKDLTFATLAFKYFPCPLTAAVLSLFVKKPGTTTDKHEAEVDFAAFGDDPIKLARGERGFVFCAFTALPAWNPPSPGEPAWKEFDIAAFKEALKSLNQFNQKTEERRATENDLRGRLAVMLGGRIEGWKPRKNEAGEEEATPQPLNAELFRLARELERELTEELDDQVLGEEREFRFGDTVHRFREGAWRVSSASLRGLRDIVEAWTKLHSEHEEKLTRDHLVTVVKERQRDEKKRKSIGSVPLFLHLCEEKYWPLWLEDGDHDEDGGGRSFLASMAVFHNTFRNFLRSLEPINLTPAEPRHSRRLYMFSDLKDKEAKVAIGGTKGAFTVECAIALRTEGAVKESRVRLSYSARRLLRDELQGGVESRWLQPMTSALGLPMPEIEPDAGFESAVSLMPDPDPGSRGPEPDIRFLLNFPVTLDPTWIHDGIGRSSIWKGQFNGTRDKNLHLHWPGTLNAKVKGAESPWWKDAKVIDEGFTCVSVDLGQRTAGAWALLRVTCRDPREGEAGTKRPVREIGYDGERRWFAEVMTSGLLRLPGEDQMVIDAEGNRAVEHFGKAGRNALEPEWEAGRQLAAALLADKPENWLGATATEKSLPKQNDSLITLANRRLSRLSTFHRWSCFDPDRPEVAGRRDNLIQKLTEELNHWQDAEVKDWKGLAEAGDFAGFRSAAGRGFTTLREQLGVHLVALANRVAPWRDRSWEWQTRTTGAKEGLYGELVDSGKQLSIERTKIRGQRGLSMARIEQLDNLRRLFLRYNRSFDREPEKKARFGRSDFGRKSGEPCRLLLDKIDRMKEQRVNQTAHMIVAQALGIRLKAHTISAPDRESRDIHGEYEMIPGREPVDFIVIENLDRYLTSQGRGPSENSRLMHWAHRKVRDKIKMLAEEPFGIPVVETAAAYSSRFCAITSEAGARCEERAELDEHLKTTLESRRDRPPKPGQPKPADFAKLLEQFDDLDKLNAKLTEARAAGRTGGSGPFSLVLPRQGGPLFLPRRGGRLDQADRNAAINIGLRAVAAPVAFDILHKIRTEKDGDGFRPVTKNAREKSAFRSKPTIKLTGEVSDKLAKAKTPNFFYNLDKQVGLDAAELSLDKQTWTLASGIGLWATVNRSIVARIVEINEGRLSRYRQKMDDLEGAGRK